MLPSADNSNNTEQQSLTVSATIASQKSPIPLSTIQSNLSQLGKDANGRIVLKKLELVDLGLEDLEREILEWVDFLGEVKEQQVGGDGGEEVQQEEPAVDEHNGEQHDGGETHPEEGSEEEHNAEVLDSEPQSSQPPSSTNSSSSSPQHTAVPGFTLKNIQILHLQNNHLSFLPPFQILSAQLPSISVLNLSNNQLTSTEPLSLEAFPNLIECNLANNALESFYYEPKTFHSLLRRLNLSNNRISEIKLSNTPQLTFLDLSHNHLSGDALETLTDCGIRQLNVAHNRIASLTAQHLCPDTLQELNASSNQISSLDFVPELRNLKKLDLSANAVDDRVEILLLRNNRYLKEVSLDGTPLAEQDDEYAEFALSTLPASLLILDGEQVTAVMKVKSKNFFGEDAEKRDQILDEVFGA